jgi:hypothetical protein
MLFEEIIPHLNKMASIYLVNNKRKVGYIFADSSAAAEGDREVVYFLTVMKSRKLVSLMEGPNFEKLEKISEEIPISEIRKIRSVET